MSEQLLTVNQVAERLNVGAGLVYDLVASRRIRSCRIGNGRGRIRIPESALEEYIERVTMPVAGPAPKRPARPSLPASAWPDRLPL